MSNDYLLFLLIFMVLLLCFYLDCLTIPQSPANVDPIFLVIYIIVMHASGIYLKIFPI